MGLLTDLIENKVAEGRKEKNDQASFYLDAIKSGRLSPSDSDTPDQVTAKRQQLDYALDQYGKLSGASKEHKNLLSQVVGGIYDKIHGKPSPSVNSQLPVPEGASQPQVSNGPQSQTNPLPMPTGVQTQTQPAQAAPSNIQAQLPTPSPVKASTPAVAPSYASQNSPLVSLAYPNADALAGTERKRRMGVAKGAGLNDQDAAEYAETGKWPPHQKRIADKGVARPGLDPGTGEPYKGTWDHTVETDGTETWAKRDDKPVNQQLIWMKYPDDPENAKPHAVRIDPRDTTKKLDQDTGKPVPEGATTVDQTLLAAEIRQRSYGQMGNLSRALIGQGYSPQEADRIAGEQVEADFQKRMSLLGAGKITEAYGVGGTQTHVVPNGGTGPSVPPPQSNSPSGGGVAPSKVPAPAPSSAAPAIKPAQAPRAKGQASAVPSVQAAPGETILPGASLAQARQAATQFAPVSAAVTEIYGDPKQPDLHPLSSYAKLADNKASQERIGTAIQLTLNGFGDSIKDIGADIGAGPVHVSAGDFGKWISNKLNLPSSVASAQAKTLRDVIDKMTPEEKEAYNSTMATMSVMAGLRSISRNSAAMGSLALIERELPKIGLNATDSRTFYDQLQRTAGAIANYANTPLLFPLVRDPHTGGTTRLGATPEMMDRIRSLTTEIQKKKDSASASPKTKNSLPVPGKAPKNAAEYMEMNGIK